MSALGKVSSVVVFDTETTGLSNQKDYITEFSAVKYEVKDGRIGDEIDYIDVYMRPPIPIPVKIEEKTGITNKFISQFPPENPETAHKIADFFGESLLAGHNVNFDVGFVSAMFRRQDVDFEFLPDMLADTLVFSRDLLPDISSHRLADVAAVYEIGEGVTYHNALEDVKVTGKLLRFFIAEYRDEIAKEGNTPKLRASVQKVSYWAGYRGKSRIYVTTDIGDVYYDIFKKSWGEKTPGVLDRLDMDHVEEQSIKAAGCETVEDFARFKGAVRCY